MSIISTVPKGAAVEGINPNLLRNWYFVGGGTGRGIFPVNSRGQTSYGTGQQPCIDGWYQIFGSGGVNVVLSQTGLSLGPVVTSNHGDLRQFLHCSPLVGKTVTASILLSNGTLITGTDVVSGTAEIYPINTIYQDGYLRFYVNATNNTCRIYRNGNSIEIAAVKLELGDQQTLCHQENGVWVLNEIPDYEIEYYKCITSDADSTDTYANQKVSNITVQCNSVGSSSLRYYNKLIQSTHKVLDSTFSNPAAQTSDITVTTYDGYLDFSNGFASGATTNITLVLGTSGPVLSTTTTAPS